MVGGGRVCGVPVAEGKKERHIRRAGYASLCWSVFVNGMTAYLLTVFRTVTLPSDIIVFTMTIPGWGLLSSRPSAV